MKGWDDYLSKSASRRDLPNTYRSRRSLGERVKQFFINASDAIERPFRLGRASRIPSLSRAPERIDLSHISSDETFVIAGERPNGWRRFWRRLKKVLEDDTRPRVPYNARHQFPIRGQRPSASAMARQRKREMADSVDLSTVALTIERGKIK